MTQIVPFSYSGSAATYNYWTEDWSSTVPKCKLVNWKTEWSLFQYDDYKRCVCESSHGSGEGDCPWVEEVLQPGGNCDWAPTVLNSDEIVGFIGQDWD